MSCQLIWLLSTKLENKILFFCWASFVSKYANDPSHLPSITHRQPIPPPVLFNRASHISIQIDFSELYWDYATFYHQFLAVSFLHLPNASTPFFHLLSAPSGWVTYKVEKHVGDMNPIASTNWLSSGEDVLIKMKVQVEKHVGDVSPILSMNSLCKK